MIEDMSLFYISLWVLYIKILSLKIDDVRLGMINCSISIDMINCSIGGNIIYLE